MDEAELLNLIKEITINYLNTLKSNKNRIDFTTDNDVINIKYKNNKTYRISFSDINPTNSNDNKDITQIYFYYNFDIKLMKKKQNICYDFDRIVNSYPKLPEILNEFDDFVFFNYGLKFMDIDYL